MLLLGRVRRILRVHQNEVTAACVAVKEGGWGDLIVERQLPAWRIRVGRDVARVQRVEIGGRIDVIRCARIDVDPGKGDVSGATVAGGIERRRVHPGVAISGFAPGIDGKQAGPGRLQRGFGWEWVTTIPWKRWRIGRTALTRAWRRKGVVDIPAGPGVASVRVEVVVREKSPFRQGRPRNVWDRNIQGGLTIREYPSEVPLASIERLQRSVE